MASMVRPSLILKMNLDEHIYSKETIANIKRSYSYVAPSLVESHETGDARPENVMRFLIKLHRPYWDANDEASNELWNNVMPKWMHNMFYKMSSTITASNKMCATHGEQKLPYAWLELEFGENALIALATASDSSFPESFIDTVEQVRTLDASNVFGEGDISCIRIPSRKSYEAQLEQAIAKKAQEDEEAAAGGEDVAAGGEEAPEQDVAGEGEAAGGEEMAQTAANAAAQAAEGEPAFTWPELPAFDVDYSIWGIEFTNGEVCEFNSETNSFEE